MPSPLCGQVFFRSTSSAAIEILPASSARLPELLEREGWVERAQRNAYYEIGLELRAIRDGGLYKIDREQQIGGRFSFQTFEEYVQERWEWPRDRAYKLINAATVAENVSNLLHFQPPQRESHVRELLKLETDAERAAVWQEVIRERDGQPVRASDVRELLARDGEAAYNRLL